MEETIKTKKQWALPELTIISQNNIAGGANTRVNEGHYTRSTTYKQSGRTFHNLFKPGGGNVNALHARSFYYS